MYSRTRPLLYHLQIVLVLQQGSLPNLCTVVLNPASTVFLHSLTFRHSPKNLLTLTAPPVACWVTRRPVVTLGLTSTGVSSGVMRSRSLTAPLWIALLVAPAPCTRPRLNHEAPEHVEELACAEIKKKV